MLDSTLVTIEGNSNNIELWDLEADIKIALGQVVILSGVISNYQKVAYIDADKHEVKIVSPKGEMLSTIPATENWVEILDWPDREHLLIGNMPYRPNGGGWDPPSSTISLDIRSGKNIEFLPKYPNIYDYQMGPPDLGYYSYSVAAYDPSLTRVVYPAVTSDLEYMVLLDILEHQEITRFHIPFPFSDIRWNKDGTFFIISLPPLYKDFYGNIYKNVSDDLPYVGGNELFLVSRNGEIKRLTYLSTKYAINEYSFSWSSNNEYVAFWLTIGTDNPEWQLAILKIKTGELTSYCIDDNDEGSLPIVWASDSNQLISTISKKDYVNQELILIDAQKNRSTILSLENRIVIGWLDNIH